ncbi:DnaD domain protein [Peptoniphilus sp. KCTC 25270]|uniref:DnaD domain-containing protein n=1 Tax=Peptoniphilus sp. KCTC 25270 TaxID=2897414 RepID=UPI001E527CE8|nr:DnaD domain protein [Peptoniphilus sp. KCTC 25270]MCD1147729.1 DnaD domain protein [Peptoniphilus sp. KCTC 25270]
MRYELEKLEMDFGDTSIENIFLNDYMPQANGDFVKVYLIAYQLAKQGVNEAVHLSHDAIAQRLGILESDVIRAWDYWEEEGIIEKIFDSETDDFGVRFLNLKELYTKNVYSRMYGGESKGEKFYRSLDNPEIANLFSQASYYMRRDLPYQQKQKIGEWIELYNMPPRLIIEAFRYGTESKGKRSLAYIEGIVRNWADENVRTPEALEENFRRRDDVYYRYNRLMQCMGIGHKGYIEEDALRVDSWHKSWGFSMEMLEEAAKRTSKSKNPNWNYMEKILLSWKSKEIFTLADVEKDVKPQRERGTQRNIQDSRTSRYSKESLDDMAKKKWENFQKNREGNRS